MTLLPTATGQCYVFTRVCDSVNRVGGGSASVHAGIPPPPPESMHPPGKQTPPREACTLRKHAPLPEAYPPGIRNERPVRILLECILVLLTYTISKFQLLQNRPNKINQTCERKQIHD